MCMNYDECLKVLKDISKNKEIGTRLPKGVAVYRNDKRDEAEIKENGFVPATLVDKGEDLVAHARKQAKEVLSDKQVLDFIRAWKTPALGDKKLFQANGHGMPGVSCGIKGGQMSGNEYRINLPELVLVDRCYGAGMQKNNCVAVYGDNTNLEKCNVLAMHLIQIGDAQEFVFLTNVLPEWIEKVD